MTAAISSSRGSECCLIGAALAFDITRCDSVPDWKYAAAPYALGLASAKTCKTTSALCSVAMHLRGDDSVVAWSISQAIAFHSVHSFSSRSLSQSCCCCHNCCMNSLAEIVTGVISPNGSNMLEAHFRMARFVLAEVKTIDSGLGDGKMRSS